MSGAKSAAEDVLDEMHAAEDERAVQVEILQQQIGNCQEAGIAVHMVAMGRAAGGNPARRRVVPAARHADARDVCRVCAGTAGKDEAQ